MLTHIFFSGSHIWGIPYIGIIKYMQFFPNKFKFIKDFGGVSFGSVIALMLALKMPIDIIQDISYKQSNDFNFGEAVYDLELENNQIKTRLLEGKVQLNKQVTTI